MKTKDIEVGKEYAYVTAARPYLRSKRILMVRFPDKLMGFCGAKGKWNNTEAFDKDGVPQQARYLSGQVFDGSEWQNSEMAFLPRNVVELNDHLRATLTIEFDRKRSDLLESRAQENQENRIGDLLDMLEDKGAPVAPSMKPEFKAMYWTNEGRGKLIELLEFVNGTIG